MAKIFCFGDSITYGSRDFFDSGWYSLLRRSLDERMAENIAQYNLMYNLGVSGETTKELVERFENETRARIGHRPKEETIFIFQFGTNDAAFLGAPDKPVVSKEDFIKNYHHVLSLARTFSDKIIVLNIPPVIAEITAVQEKARTNEVIDEYNRALGTFCLDEGLICIDIYSAFAEEGERALLYEDGYHPNTSGHRLIFELVESEISDLLPE